MNVTAAYSYDFRTAGERQAGMMDYPDGVLDPVLDWVWSVWESTQNLLNRSRGGTKQKKFTVTREMLESWRYTSQLEGRFPDVMAKMVPLNLTVKLLVSRSSRSAAGSCAATREITVAFGSSTDFDSISQTLTHELTHWGQNFMKLVLRDGLKKDVEPGLPAKNLRDEGVQQKARGRYLELHTLHKLDDREFYPLVRGEFERVLNDLDETIDRAERYWTHPNDAPMHESYAAEKARNLFPHLEKLVRFYVGLDTQFPSQVPDYVANSFVSLGDSIFDVAKEHNPEKWGKAVSLFLKFVRPYFDKAKWKKALGDPSVSVRRSLM